MDLDVCCSQKGCQTKSLTHCTTTPFSSGADVSALWDTHSANSSDPVQAVVALLGSLCLSSLRANSNELASELELSLWIVPLVALPMASSSEVLGGVGNLQMFSSNGHLTTGTKNSGRVRLPSSAQVCSCLSGLLPSQALGPQGLPRLREPGCHNFSSAACLLHQHMVMLSTVCLKDLQHSPCWLLPLVVGDPWLYQPGYFVLYQTSERRGCTQCSHALWHCRHAPVGQHGSSSQSFVTMIMYPAWRVMSG